MGLPPLVCRSLSRVVTCQVDPLECNIMPIPDFAASRDLVEPSRGLLLPVQSCHYDHIDLY